MFKFNFDSFIMLVFFYVFFSSIVLLSLTLISDNSNSLVNFIFSKKEFKITIMFFLMFLAGVPPFSIFFLKLNIILHFYINFNKQQITLFLFILNNVFLVFSMLSSFNYTYHNNPSFIKSSEDSKYKVYTNSHTSTLPIILILLLSVLSPFSINYFVKF